MHSGDMRAMRQSQLSSMSSLPATPKERQSFVFGFKVLFPSTFVVNGRTERTYQRL